MMISSPFSARSKEFGELVFGFEGTICFIIKPLIYS